MSQKRRDRKKRILRDRESQCKDGRYRYSYLENGKRKDIYSWKLEETDKLPVGKRECVALRVMEEEILKEQLWGKPNYPQMTVLELVERYVRQKQGVRDTTRAGYKTVINMMKKDPFGERRINEICISDAKLWLIELQSNGKRYSTIHTIRGVVRPAFQMAVEDDILDKNPFSFELGTVLVNDSVTREAITRKQERQFLEFVRNDKHFSRYYEAIFILFKTGMRISEFCGLTISDINMKERTINIDHQLLRTSEMKYIIEDTKSTSGTRVLPMTNEVYESFQKILANRKKPKTEPMVGGKAGFLYLDKNGKPMVVLHWQKYFQHICEKYNKTYRGQMPKEELKKLKLVNA
jgi:site-specific recombinase XerD